MCGFLPFKLCSLNICSNFQGLAAMVGAFPTIKTNPEQAVRLTRRIWVAKFDLVEENRWEF